jgi:hypothetical protein
VARTLIYQTRRLRNKINDSIQMVGLSHHRLCDARYSMPWKEHLSAPHPPHNRQQAMPSRGATTFSTPPSVNFWGPIEPSRDPGRSAGVDRPEALLADSDCPPCWSSAGAFPLSPPLALMAAFQTFSLAISVLCRVQPCRLQHRTENEFTLKFRRSANVTPPLLFNQCLSLDRTTIR